MTARLRNLKLLAGLALAAAGCGHAAVEELETTAAVPVMVEPARVDTLQTTITVTGSIVPAPGADWVIVAPAAARIAELPKAENDLVREGDVLVRFDAPSLTADLEAKRAEVTQATVKVQTAKANVARLTGLLAQGVAAPREVDEAKQLQADAESALSQAQSGAAAAQAIADRAVVRARFSGVVAKRWHNPGDLVDASSSDPVLRVINPSMLHVVAAVPMSALGRVVVGRKATIRGPAGEGEPATVLTKPAQVDPATSTADVRLSFSGLTRWPAGTVVQVEIVAETREKALVVPTAAIVYEDNEIFVMVAGTDNRAHKFPVVLGLSTHELTEIKVGLEAGASVIVRGQQDLPEGATIQIQK